MEQEQNTSLFGFGIDPTSRVHLAEAARWARFLAIVGFVMCGLVVIIGIFAGSIMSSMMSGYSEEFGGRARFGGGLGAFMSILYIGFAILYFFPCLFLFRFANLMKTALNTNEQGTLNTSFQNLKIMFRYVGILTIIVLSIYAIIFLLAIASVASMGKM